MAHISNTIKGFVRVLAKFPQMQRGDLTDKTGYTSQGPLYLKEPEDYHNSKISERFAGYHKQHSDTAAGCHELG